MKAILVLICGVLSAASSFASDLSIVVLKGDRRLEVFRGKQKIHSFRIGLGGSPVGDKVRSGDGKTPEGRFYVCVKNPKSRFYLSLGISYPDIADAERGLREGIITRQEHDQIVAAHAKKASPPWNTALGGEIFIHGHGSASDWTLGCVALDNAEIKTLFDLVAPGTPVEIRP
jgi:murein L,D-transpeptidase YafK